MENRFLCRGKRIDTGEWAEGHLITDETDDSKCFIGYVIGTDEDGIPHDLDVVQVEPSTICQCTGYEGIYEKDIFQCDDERYVIEWCDYSLCWEAQAIGSSESISLGEFRPDEIVAIGNAIDNPELLEVQP